MNPHKSTLLALIIGLWNVSALAQSAPTEAETLAWLNTNVPPAYYELCRSGEEKKEWTTKMKFATEGPILIIEVTREQISGKSRISISSIRVDRRQLPLDKFQVSDSNDDEEQRLTSCGTARDVVKLYATCQTEDCIESNGVKSSFLALTSGYMSRQALTNAWFRLLQLGGARKSIF